MKIVFLGAPGVGKGTQSSKVSKILGVPHVSTGDVLRDHMRRKTDIGVKIVEIMNSGSLVGDDIVLKLVEERIGLEDCNGGFILDGFPRTINQAEKLDEMCNVDCAVSICVGDDVIVSRMKGRLVCLDCKATFNLVGYRPKVDGVCDFCSNELTRRAEDNPEALQNRLEIYRTESEPIQRYYEKKNKFFEVDGSKPVGEITASILEILAKVERNGYNS